METRRIALPGRRLLTIRPVEGADIRGIKELFAGLSEDDLYRRFFSWRPPPDRFIERMASVASRGGAGIVATVEGPAQPARVVAEASYVPLPGGDAELGITVAGPARGWLGPFLLDLMLEDARGHGISNLQAEVLLMNGQMLAILEMRRYAVIDIYDGPPTVRVCVGTAGPVPAWSPDSGRPRVLVEAAGGRWEHYRAVRDAGFQVLACPGIHRRLVRCPALEGRPCPLAATADVILEALPAQDGRRLLDAHEVVHPAVPVALRPPGSPATPGAEIVDLLRTALATRSSTTGRPEEAGGRL